MSALARWFKHQGAKVCGYDRTPSPLTEALQSEGMEIHFEDSLDCLPEELKSLNNRALIVYTPAVPATHKQLNFLSEKGFRLYKRAEVLGLISEKDYTVGVAGTHGKTTTSSMLAHLLDNAHQNCTAFLGGISKNFKSNLRLAQNTEMQNCTVVEADEYDRSFLQLHPNQAIVTSVDPDHLDIYGEADAFVCSFGEFVNRIEDGGKCWLSDKVSGEALKIKQTLEVKRYGLEDDSLDAFACNIRVDEGYSVFDFREGNTQICDLRLLTPGEHNIENMTAAIAVALSLGCTEENIRSGVESYTGVKRRFEYIVKRKDFVFMDDYAHHPTEVSAFLNAVKKLYPGRELSVIFQPHLFSRTKDFAKEFGKSLSLADRLYLLDIYPAREEPMEGVSSKLILDEVMNNRKHWFSEAELLQHLKAEKPEVLVTLGAGDVFKLIEPIGNLFE